jgi:hypothetical protein
MLNGDDGPSSEGDPEQRVFNQGVCFRTHLCESACKVGVSATIIATAVVGLALSFWPEHGRSLLWIAAGVLSVPLLNALRATYRCWFSRRCSAFEVYFYGNNLMQYLYDANRTAELFYELNPLPMWSILDHNWYRRIVKPDINQVLERAPKPQKAYVLGPHGEGPWTPDPSNATLATDTLSPPPAATD